MRKVLKRCLKSLKEEYEKRPYEYWKIAQLPLSFEMVFENKEIQIEIFILEETNEYINVGITADCSFVSQFFPACETIVIEKSVGKSKE